MDHGNFQDILNTPPENRDVAWRKEFFELILASHFSLHEEFTGPDDFPYLRLVIAEPDSKEYVEIRDVLDWLLDKGSGIASFDIEGKMLWVFSYGNLRSLKERGNFEISEIRAESNTDRVEKKSIAGIAITLEQRKTQESREIFIGQPSENFFPQYARRVVIAITL